MQAGVADYFDSLCVKPSGDHGLNVKHCDVVRLSDGNDVRQGHVNLRPATAFEKIEKRKRQGGEGGNCGRPLVCGFGASPCIGFCGCVVGVIHGHTLLAKSPMSTVLLHMASGTTEPLSS